MGLYVKDKIPFHPKSVDGSQCEEELEAVFNYSPYSSKICFHPYLDFLKEQVKTAQGHEKIFTEKALAAIEENKHFTCTFDSKEELAPHTDLVQLLLSGLFPVVGKKDLMFMVSGPFEHDPFYVSPELEKLILNSGGLTTMSADTAMELSLKHVWAGCHILNACYGQEIPNDPRFFVKIGSAGEDAAKYFMARMNTDFVEVKPLKPLKPLSKKEIEELLNNVEDRDLWSEKLPRENFQFKGFVIGQLTDISEEESISILKQKLLEKDALTNAGNLRPLEDEFRILMQDAGLRIGITALDYPERNVLHQYKIRYNLLADYCTDILDEKYKGSIYEKTIIDGVPVVYPDLTALKEKTELEEELIRREIRSLILYPLHNSTGKLIGLAEVGCPQAGRFNSFALHKLKKIGKLFDLAMERSREEVDNKIEAVIREEYTTVHSSVEWKFIEKAYNLMNSREGKFTELPEAQPIRFPDVHPLFGQADIVGSSVLRNDAIRADLLENLRLAEQTLIFAEKRTSYPLTSLHLQEVQRYEGLLEERYQTSDESEIVEFLHVKIHPYFKFLCKEDKRLVRRINTYFNKLDEEYSIVYNKRKNYEKSVSILNKRMGAYLEKSQKSAQEMIPHYFEKYATDGVEFEIYAGESITQQKDFTDTHLKNLRLWQLETLCDITQGVAEMKDKLPVPLTTAQMIFVYSQPVSIRFRLDEKRFDVDGAYNVRYKILKKRIDKAVVQGTGERVTVSGKIAIVYTTERDRLEYLEYLQYLKNKGVIEQEIEELEIAPLQGVDGLRALRVTVMNKEKINGKKSDKLKAVSQLNTV